MFSRCEICLGTCRPVFGSGPRPAHIMGIGERPGGDENKVGIPFVGKAGQEQTETYFPLAGLDRDDIYITNTVKCFAEGNRKPTDKEIAGCAAHFLEDEIDEVNPNIIILLGGTACSLIPSIDLDIHHGIPQYVDDFFGWSGPVIPMYHPAAGMHDGTKMIPLLEDWERLESILAGEFPWEPDPYPNPDYRILTTEDEVNEVLLDHPWHGTGQKIRMAIDTERHGSTPYSIQFSIKPGTGYMLMAESSAARSIAKLTDKKWVSPIAYLGYTLAKTDAEDVFELILHNAGQDLEYLEAQSGFKFSLSHLQIRDTMQEAYHLGNLPQGLKALAYRLFGVRMTSYADIVKPASREAIVHWLWAAIDFSQRRLYTETTKQLKTKVKVTRKPGEWERAFNRIVRYAIVNQDYDPWDKIEELRQKLSGIDKNLEKTEWALITGQELTTVGKVISKIVGDEAAGPMPIEGIAHVPIETQVRYACADADMTLRVGNRLDEIRQELTAGEWDIADSDMDNIL